MAYPSKAVANHFLDLARSQNAKLDPMKLQKLIYFAHGWNLHFTGKPLINERIGAWDYGPVIPTIYHEFKKFGAGPIEKYATDLVIADSEMRFHAPKISDSAGEDQSFAEGLMQKIWDVYGKYSGIQLSNMTHQLGTPWYRVREENEGQNIRNVPIPDSYMKEYFDQLAEINRAKKSR